MKERDIKLLWGRAGGTCSFEGCRRKLTEDPTAVSDALPLGEHAHIVAESMDGPRGQSVLDPAARDGYTNRILLCPTHHTLIDKAPNDYPVERLHMMKRDHELWVEQQLGAYDERTRVAQETYSALIDIAVEACNFPEWSTWTGRVLSSRPRWKANGIDSIREFRRRIIAAAWPGTNPELERALKTLSIYMNAAAQRFWQESEDEGEFRVEVKYYKKRYYPQAQYDALFARWETWQRDCEFLIIQSAKAANWMADVVRRDLNPAFFSITGKFSLTISDDLRFRTFLPEFSANEKAVLPQNLSLEPPPAEAGEED
jgi:hypothetical protein